MNNSRNAYAEVYTILQGLDLEEYNKIPPEVIKAIKKYMNGEYKYKLDDELELKDQPMLKETKAILFNLFRDYLATPEQKEKIVKIQSKERQKNELKKKQQYSVDIFQNKIKKKTNQIQNQKTEIIEYK